MENQKFTLEVYDEVVEINSEKEGVPTRILTINSEVFKRESNLREIINMLWTFYHMFRTDESK